MPQKSETSQLKKINITLKYEVILTLLVKTENGRDSPIIECSIYVTVVKVNGTVVLFLLIGFSP